jgi:AraC-like DNA-binding protein
MTPEEAHLPDSIIDDLWPVLKRTTLEERIQILTDYILSSTQASDEGSIPLLDGADYFNDPSIQPAKAIADDASLSDRTIQLRFKKYVGYSPKEMLRFLRFKQVINSITQSSEQEIDWFNLIYDFGYHDQSHLIKDFNHYLGTTPQAFIKTLAGKDFCTTKPGKRY